MSGDLGSTFATAAPSVAGGKAKPYLTPEQTNEEKSLLAGVDPGQRLKQLAQQREQSAKDVSVSKDQVAETLTKLQTPQPQYKDTPPEQTWGSAAMALAALGGVLTHRPLTTSLNAMAGVMKAYHQNDEEAYKTAYTQWKTSHDDNMTVLKWQQQQYMKALEAYQKTGDSRQMLAEISGIAAYYKAEATLNAANRGDVGETTKLVTAYNKSVDNAETAGRAVSPTMPPKPMPSAPPAPPAGAPPAAAAAPAPGAPPVAAPAPGAPPPAGAAAPTPGAPSPAGAPPTAAAAPAPGAPPAAAAAPAAWTPQDQQHAQQIETWFMGNRKQPLDPADRAAVSVAAHEMVDWAKENPKATPTQQQEQANKFFQQAKAPPKAKTESVAEKKYDLAAAQAQQAFKDKHGAEYIKGSDPATDAEYAGLLTDELKKQSPVSGRNIQITQRMLTSAKDAVADLKNVAELPISISTGVFGSRKSGPSLYDATKEDLANTVTSEEAQAYNTQLAGLERALGGLSTGGLAVDQNTMEQFGKLQIREGDTNLIKLRKLATMRQNVDNALDSILANPQLDKKQSALIEEMRKDLSQAIPWSPHDVNLVEFSSDGKTSVGNFAKKALKAPEPPPPELAARLKDGVITTFGNGQSWTLHNGKPQQVQ